MCRVDPHASRFTGGLDHLKYALLKSLVSRHEAVPVPPQRLDPLAAVVDRQKQIAIGRVAAERAANDPREPVTFLPHVGRRGVKENR